MSDTCKADKVVFNNTVSDIMDDLALQVDEIEALSSIYPDEWRSGGGNDRSYTMRIVEGCYDVTVYITLAIDYPSHTPPTIQLSAPNLSRMHKQQVALELDDLYLEYIGQPVLYQVIERIREYLQSIQKPAAEVEEDDMSKKSGKEKDKNYKHYNKNAQKTPIEEPQLEIHHGPIIQDRKSIFQGHCAAVHSLKDIKDVTEKLMENKKIAEATHNISAYRVQQAEKSNILQDYNDDGETHAGRRLLHLLQILDVNNILVIVSRWYGGVQLGPDRFRHINNAGRQVLDQAGYIEQKK